MGESKPKSEEPEKKRRFSQEQYDMLLRCSQKKDVTEWNEWRKENPDENISLENADFKEAYLDGVNLSDADLWNANLTDAQLEGADLGNASLNGAKLIGVNLKDADLGNAYLEGVNLNEAHLENVNFIGAYLKDARISDTHLEGARFFLVNLQNANFQLAIVDGSTLFGECTIDRYTDFRNVGLHSARIEQEIKQLLEYNNRRMNWEEWYRGHWFWRWPVRLFWAISDYGISTKQIIKTFFQWALIFAAVYLAWGLIDYHLVGLKDDPGIVSNLFVLEGEQETVSPCLVPFRAVYFSIVTMTTLGFGDMYANAHSFLRGLFGHALLALQVILGYVLLGALITRFAVLFTAGGPAGKFADEKKKSEEE